MLLQRKFIKKIKVYKFQYKKNFKYKKSVIKSKEKSLIHCASAVYVHHYFLFIERIKTKYFSF